MSLLNHNQSSLLINGLELHLHLGWPDHEREEKQMVLVDIEIFFDEIPLACRTDQLKDTLCYSELIQQLQTQLSQKSFHLIEHLSYEIHRILGSLLTYPAEIIVRIRKYPHISGLSGGVQFSYRK